MLAHQRQSGGRLVVAFDDHVLQQFAEARLDRALVAAVDVEIIGDGALLADVTVGLDEHHASSVAELAARGDELLERGQPCLEPCQILLAGAHAANARLMLGSGRGQLGLVNRPLKPDVLERLVGARQCLAAGNALRVHLLHVQAKIGLFDVQFAKRLADALALRRGMLHRVAQRRRGIQRGKHLATRRLDVAFESFDLLLRARVRVARLSEHRCRLVARTLGVGTRLMARLDRDSRRFAPRLEVADFLRNLRRPRGQRTPPDDD